jgi:hypothetical protein
MSCCVYSILSTADNLNYLFLDFLWPFCAIADKNTNLLITFGEHKKYTNLNILQSKF